VQHHIVTGSWFCALVEENTRYAERILAHMGNAGHQNSLRAPLIVSGESAGLGLERAEQGARHRR
jgi:hypothetical protein